MFTSTVTIRETWHRLLQELAAKTGQTTEDVLDKALDAYRRRLFFDQANAGYADLRVGVVRPHSYLFAWCKMKLLASCLIAFITLIPLGCSKTSAPPAKEPVWSVAFSPDGKHLAAGGGLYRNMTPNPDTADGEVKVWDVSTWKLEATFRGQGFTDHVRSVRFSPDGSALAALSEGYARKVRGSINPHGGTEILIWNMVDKTEHKWIKLESSGAFGMDLDFSPKEDLLTVGRTGGPSVVLDWKKGVKRYDLPMIPKSYDTRYAFSPSGARIIAACERVVPTLHIFDTSTGKEIGDFDLNAAQASCLQFSPDKSLLAAGCTDGSIYLIDADLTRTAKALDLGMGRIRQIAMSPGNKLLVAATDSFAFLVDVESGKVKQSYPHLVERFVSVALSPDGKKLAIAGADSSRGNRQTGILQVWDVPSGQMITTLD